MCVIVKSFNKRRMKENMQIFDWELRDDELEKKKKKKIISTGHSKFVQLKK